jgi:hypothetical protein
MFIQPLHIRMRELREFQKSMYGPHVRQPFARKLRDCLSFVTTYPRAVSEVGLIPFGDRSFLVNSKACAAFLGIKSNSYSRNFREHGFELDPSFMITQELRHQHLSIVLSRRAWAKRTFADDPFNAESGDADIEQAVRHSIAIRKGKPPPGPFLEEQDDYFRGPAISEDDLEFGDSE